jgi:hypothetical protein
MSGKTPLEMFRDLSVGQGSDNQFMISFVPMDLLFMFAVETSEYAVAQLREYIAIKIYRLESFSFSFQCGSYILIIIIIIIIIIMY